MTDDIKLPPLPPLHIVPSVEPVDYPEVAQALMDYAREAVRMNRCESRASTHAEGCWNWGPGHYGCAVREIERLREDAERYRWLRARWGRIADEYDGDSDQLVAIREADSHFEGWDVDPASLDRAIDAAPCRKPARGETMDEVWVGCGECDVCFPCHNGQQKCLRLPAEPSPIDLD